jgi:hypothetical protein
MMIVSWPQRRKQRNFHVLIHEKLTWFAISSGDELRNPCVIVDDIQVGHVPAWAQCFRSYLHLRFRRKLLRSVMSDAVKTLLYLCLRTVIFTEWAKIIAANSALVLYPPANPPPIIQLVNVDYFGAVIYAKMKMSWTIQEYGMVGVIWN